MGNRKNPDRGRTRNSGPRLGSKTCPDCKGQGEHTREDWSPVIGKITLTKRCKTCKGRKVI